MESQLEHLDEIMRCWNKFQEELPDAMAAHTAFKNEVYKGGALSTKVKRLIALAVGLQAGCPGCILSQTKFAIEAGATKAEVLEAVAVALSMGGTLVSSWSWMVVKEMEEMKKW